MSKRKNIIGMARQRTKTRVYVYDDEGYFLFSRPGQLRGFTATMVTIEDKGRVKSYDVNGKYVFTR
jgi:hypothetical protein